MKASRIFKETVELLHKGTRRIVHQGGQSAGKTVNILIALMYCAVHDKTPGVTTITSMSFPHLKAGAMRDFEMYVYPQFIKAIKSYHKTDHTITLKNGSIIEFKTYETEYAARGPRRKRLFINEANTFDYMTYFQLDSRSEQTIVDYNPTIRFWVHDKIIGQKGTEFRRSWHEHNPFLTAEKHQEIESIKDPELWKVYARGYTGNVTGIIYPNWTMVEEIPFGVEKFIYGLDYGYTNDPTALVQVGRLGNKLYLDEIVYQVGSIPPKTIKKLLLQNDYKKEFPIYSEHDPDMIKQLRLLDVTVLAARKTAGSIKAGIEKLKEYDVFYTGRSRNIKRETGLYIWHQNELGDFTNVPIDSNNHALDAIRYAVYTHFYRDKNAA